MSDDCCVFVWCVDDCDVLVCKLLYLFLCWFAFCVEDVLVVDVEVRFVIGGDFVDALVVFVVRKVSCVSVVAHGSFPFCR